MAKDSIPSQSALEQSHSGIEAVPLVTGGAAETAPEPMPIPIAQDAGSDALPGERRHIVKSATLVMLGNLGSSVMGMVRQIVVAGLGSSIAGPFNSAISPAQTFNDFLINGSINGALIPTFNDYAAPDKRDELRRIVFTIVNLVFLVMLIPAVGFLFTPPRFFSNIPLPSSPAPHKNPTLHFPP